MCGYLIHCTATDQSNELEDCPQSIWKWKKTANGGVLTIRIRQEVSRSVFTINYLCGYIVKILGQRND